jgi:hypothetical protein
MAKNKGLEKTENEIAGVVHRQGAKSASLTSPNRSYFIGFPSTGLPFVVKTWISWARWFV